MTSEESMESQATKSIPFSEEEILLYGSKYSTPFYLYDESIIRSRCTTLKNAFSWVDSFKNYFAVKATPNPNILKIIKEEGLGVDCSSLSELILAESVGFVGDDIYFTSNNTQIQEFAKAKEHGAIINLDDISHIDYIREGIGLPFCISFRYNPGSIRSGNKIIGDPKHSKFGLTKSQILEAYSLSAKYGVKRFGLHTMVISNCLEEDEHLETAKMMFQLVVEIKKKLGIQIEIVNFGGGIGIPYKPDQTPINLESLSSKIKNAYEEIIVSNGLHPLKIFYECGRFITGPAGFLITRIIHKKQTYKSYLGVDASMVNLMRPSLYNAYHHITVIPDVESRQKMLIPERTRYENSKTDPTSTNAPLHDVVGSLCENNDKLATDRHLGHDVQIGDLILFHDVGAHGHAMGFNYNGKLRSAEYLRKADGQNLVEIRRAETNADLFSTIQWNAV